MNAHRLTDGFIQISFKVDPSPSTTQQHLVLNLSRPAAHKEMNVEDEGETFTSLNQTDTNGTRNVIIGKIPFETDGCMIRRLLYLFRGKLLN